MSGLEAIDGVRTSGLRDVWLEHFPEPSTAAPHGFTFSADNPRKRIDYVFLRAGASGAAAASIEVIRQANGTALMSDHFGLAVRLQVERRDPPV